MNKIVTRLSILSVALIFVLHFPIKASEPLIRNPFLFSSEKVSQKGKSAAKPSSHFIKTRVQTKPEPQARRRTTARRSSILSLNGIFTSNGKRYALVNTIKVTEGDRVSGWTVESITENDVILKQSNRKLTISLGGD